MNALSERGPAQHAARMMRPLSATIGTRARGLSDPIARAEIRFEGTLQSEVIAGQAWERRTSVATRTQGVGVLVAPMIVNRVETHQVSPRNIWTSYSPGAHPASGAHSV